MGVGTHREEQSMHYRTEFRDIAYVDDWGEPCALQYRIAFTKTSPRLVVLELVQDHDDFQSPSTSHGVRDGLLNRIAAHDLPGIRVDRLCLVVTDANGRTMYAVQPDIEDYIRRVNPFSAGEKRAARGAMRETIAIRSDSIIAGRTRLETVHVRGAPLTPEVIAALDD
jgi:hypothetical protein